MRCLDMKFGRYFIVLWDKYLSVVTSEVYLEFFLSSNYLPIDI